MGNYAESHTVQDVPMSPNLSYVVSFLWLSCGYFLLFCISSPLWTLSYFSESLGLMYSAQKFFTDISLTPNYLLLRTLC